MTPALFFYAAASRRDGTGVSLNPTCGKDDVPGNQFVVDDGELRELDPRHPRHRGLSSLPVELDVVRGVSVCEQGDGGTGPGSGSSESFITVTLLEI